MSDPKQTPNQAQQPQAPSVAQPTQGNVFEQPTQQAQPTTQVAPKPTCGLTVLKENLNKPATIESFKKILGKRANAFTSALINIVGQSDQLKKVDANSIIMAAGQSAALNLPINPSLGMAAVVPYGSKAQFQIQRDGWVEIAQRSGKIAKLVNEVVYEGELKSYNRFTDEYDFTGQRISNKVIGYMAYGKTTTGFEKTLYMTREECYNHAKQYSQTFKKGYGLWKDNFDAMALKTVLKKLIKKYMPKSDELEMAIESDQAVFSQGEIGNAVPEYVDNAPTQEPIVVEAIEVDNVEVEEV